MKTVSFYGVCAATATLTLVSRRINQEYKIKEIAASFAPGADNLMTLRFFLAIDDQAPAAGAPSGVSMLQEHGQVDYVTGDDHVKKMKHEIVVKDRGSYLKVYAANADAFEHSVDVQITIDIVESV